MGTGEIDVGRAPSDSPRKPGPISLRQGYGGPPKLQRRRKDPAYMCCYWSACHRAARTRCIRSPSMKKITFNAVAAEAKPSGILCVLCAKTSYFSPGCNSPLHSATLYAMYSPGTCRRRSRATMYCLPFSM